MATHKQKLVAKILLENTGKSVSKAMKEAGYGHGSYRNPQQLTRSKGWMEITGDALGFDDEEILKIHLALLSAIKFDKKSFPVSCDDAEIKEIIEDAMSHKLIRIEKITKSKIAFFTRPDYPTIINALDKTYRLKDYYPSQRGSNVVAATENVGIRELLDRLEKDEDVECKPKFERTTSISHNEGSHKTSEERSLYKEYGLLDGVGS